MVLSALSLVEVVWPSQVLGFIEGTEHQFAGITYSLMAVECIMGTGQLRPAYWKLIFYFFTPLILMGLLCLLIHLYFRNNRNFVQAYQYCICATVVFLYFQEVARSALELFNCHEVDGKLRMRNDVTQVCYEGLHFQFALFLGLPALFLWNIILPLLMFKGVRQNYMQIFHAAT